MPAILTPALALRHLRELSTDVRAAVALAPDGRVLGGDAAIAVPAQALLEAAGSDARVEVNAIGGWILAQRSPQLAFVVVAGSRALVELLRHDVETLMRDAQDDPQAGQPALATGLGPQSLPQLQAAAQALVASADANVHQSEFPAIT